MFGIKKDKKLEAQVFVDYEHWYYAYHNKFQMKPNIEEWIEELKQEYKIKSLYVFGDFSKYNIGNDLERLKGITKNIIHTASDKDGVDKDFTDVIILDAIYRSAAKENKTKVYVLFTGDAHFTKVAEYLKELGKKVIIYGVKYSFSNKLKSVATSYVEMPRQSQEKHHYNELIFRSLYKQKQKNRSVVTYWKTIQCVADYNKVPKEKVKTAVDGLIKQKYLYQEEKRFKRGKVVSVLKADWDKISNDGLYDEFTQ